MISTLLPYKAYDLEQMSSTENSQTKCKGVEQSASRHHASNLVKFSPEIKKGYFFILGYLWPWLLRSCQGDSNER